MPSKWVPVSLVINILAALVSLSFSTYLLIVQWQDDGLLPSIFNPTMVSACFMTTTTANQLLFETGRLRFYYGWVYGLLVLFNGMMVVMFPYLLDTEEVLMANLRGKWWRLSEEARLEFQQSEQCCGFYSSLDKPAVPCPEGATRGCAMIILEKVTSFSRTYHLCLTVLTGLMLLGFLTYCMAIKQPRPQDTVGPEGKAMAA